MTPSRIAALALLTAASCGGVPPQSRDRADCPRYFIEYDRVAQFSRTETFDRWRGTYVLDPRLSQLTVLLIQNDCLTRGRDLDGLEAAFAARDGRGIVESGPLLARPVAVQVGMLTDDGDAARTQALFREIGAQTTGIGVARLGRRVYVGPVTTAGGLEDLLEFARGAGFASPYPSEFFRF